MAADKTPPEVVFLPLGTPEGGHAEISQKLGHSFCNLLYLKE